MSRILVIGDVHGTSHWKKWFSNGEIPSSIDQVVFLGDYMESHQINETLSFFYENLNEIILLKKVHMDKITLLIGNHDLYYLTDKNSPFYKNIDLFDIGMVNGCYTFSHAGFTNSYIESIKEKLQPGESIVKSINNLFHTAVKENNPELLYLFDFNQRCLDDTGDNIKQGPLWVRPKSLLEDAYYPTQIVGHTPGKDENPAFLKKGGNKVIIVNNYDASASIIVNTYILPQNFETIPQYNKRQKELLHLKNDIKSLAGQDYAKIRKEYSLTKTQFKECINKVYELYGLEMKEGKPSAQYLMALSIVASKVNVCIKKSTAKPTTNTNTVKVSIDTPNVAQIVSAIMAELELGSLYDADANSAISKELGSGYHFMNDDVYTSALIGFIGSFGKKLGKLIESSGVTIKIPNDSFWSMDKVHIAAWAVVVILKESKYQYEMCGALNRTYLIENTVPVNVRYNILENGEIDEIDITLS